MGTTYGYVRVSTKDQNVYRQLDAIRACVSSECQILIEKQSGKDFNRPQYQKLKSMLRQGDVLVIQSLDRLGRSYSQIKDEWRDLGKMGVGIRVLDFPLLNTVTDGGKQQQDLISAFISNIVLEVLSFVAENERNNIRARQAQGIAAAKQRGVKFGRDVVCLDTFYPAYCRWKEGSITAREAVEQSGMKKSTFYKRVNEVERLRIILERGGMTQEESCLYSPAMISFVKTLVEAKVGAESAGGSAP